jgi:hypothetical protein
MNGAVGSPINDLKTIDQRFRHEAGIVNDKHPK